MKRTGSCLMLVCLAVLSTCVASSQTPPAPQDATAPPAAQAGSGTVPADDQKLIQTLLDMMAAHNRHDLERELSFYTDDARFEVVGAWVKEGKEQLRELFTWDVVGNSRLTFTDFRVQDHTVTCHVKEQSDTITGLGMDAFEEDCRVTFRAGRIQETEVKISPAVLEALDRQCRAFLEWVGRTRPQELEFAKTMILGEDARPADYPKFVELLDQWQQAQKDGAAQEPAQSQVSSLAAGEFTAELNGLKLWYKVSGTGPVCLMPTAAWGPSCDLYFRTLKPLEKTFTVVYLDCRGIGRSQRAASTKEYTWDHLVADLEALRAHLKQEKVWLMGHSEGGIIALHYACRHPERVRGLVLLDTMAVADEERHKEFTSRLQHRKDEPWFAEAVHALQQKTVDSDGDMKARTKTLMPLYWADPAKIAPFAADFEATSMSAAAKQGQMDSHRFPFDLRDRLKVVTAPALIVVGDEDLFCSPFDAKRLHLCLPSSKLLLIENAGHFPWLEQPEVFFRDVPAFLEALAPGLIRPEGDPSTQTAAGTQSPSKSFASDSEADAMRASVELDHFMVWVPRSCSEEQIVSTLGAAGFNPEKIDRQDFGDAMIGRYLLFANMYLEFLWVPEELRLAAAKEDKFRCLNWETTGVSPFGVGLRRKPGTPVELPFPTRAQTNEHFGPDKEFRVLGKESDLDSCVAFVVPVAIGYDGSSERFRKLQGHPIDVHAITGVRLHVQPAGMNDTLRILSEAHLIEVVEDNAPLLEVTLDVGKQNKQIDLRPRLPLLLHF
jgi:proline iminopeptidase